MNSGELTISVGVLSSFFLQLVKVASRKWIFKDPTYDFPVWFYGISLPLLNAVMPFFMVYVLAIPASDPVLTMDWLGIGRYLLLTLVSAGISVFTNTTVNQPIKAYLKAQKSERDFSELTKE